MARTRQQAKQRKAKRLEQERKEAQRRAGRDPETSKAIAEVEQAQLDAAAELEEAQQDEVGAGAEAARSAAAAEAATAAEAVTTGQTAPNEQADGATAKPTWRERRARRAEVEPRRKEPPKTRERARPQRRERKEEVRQRGRVVNFLIQVWAELRRVQWPNRTQVTQATAVVVIFCLAAGAYLGVLDYLFNEFINWFL